jgi:eukaryotic-like serine/threonine-protein kinase
VLHFLGRYDAAQDEWQQAIDVSSADDPIVLGHLYRKLGNARRDQYRYDEAIVTYDQAETVLGSVGTTDTEAWWLAWVQLELERITTQYWLGDISEISRLVDQVRPAIEAHGSAALRARLYQTTTLALLRRDRYVVAPETLKNVRAYYQAVKEADDGNALPAAHFQYGFALLWANDLDEAERAISAALTLAERTGDISLEARCLTYLTVIARKRRQIERVRAFADQSLRVATNSQMPDYVGAAHGNLAWAAWRLGDSSAAHDHGQEALHAWRQLPAGYMFEWIGRWPLIGVALEQEDVPEAVEHAEVILDTHQQRPPPLIERALEAGIRAASDGDVEAARTYLAEAAEAARLQGYL